MVYDIILNLIRELFHFYLPNSKSHFTTFNTMKIKMAKSIYKYNNKITHNSKIQTDIKSRYYNMR